MHIKMVQVALANRVNNRPAKGAGRRFQRAIRVNGGNVVKHQPRLLRQRHLAE